MLRSASVHSRLVTFVPAPVSSHSWMPQHVISRRALLQLGSMGIAGLSLPQVLASDAAPSHSKTPEKSCIFIYQYGGLSQLDSWDPKPDAPAEQRGPYK